MGNSNNLKSKELWKKWRIFLFWLMRLMNASLSVLFRIGRYVLQVAQARVPTESKDSIPQVLWSPKAEARDHVNTYGGLIKLNAHSAAPHVVESTLWTQRTLLTQDDRGDAGGDIACSAQVDDARTGVSVGVDGDSVGEAALPHHRQHRGDSGSERVSAEHERVPRMLLQRRVNFCRVEIRPLWNFIYQ